MNKRPRKQEKIRTSKPKFRSFTDIKNYNNFLLELDNKSKKVTETVPEKKDSLENNIKRINSDYENNNLNSLYFNGQDKWEALLLAIEKQFDPNLYEEKTNKNNFIHNKNPIIEHSEKNKPKININVEINNISDLLKLVDSYPDYKNVHYNIDIESLHKIKEPLSELNNMIGMKDLKENIVDQILFYIQKLHTTNSINKGNDFMHTVIYGPPGTGKTDIAKIIGNIFTKMGILNKGTFRKVTRADLIAGYLGQTALKTRDVIKDCLGGVLFIDEAYSLGNEEKRDSFSKECIDTLCEALSDHKDNLMVIIAGYENDLNTCFFNYNQGLNSRFTWRFKTDEYSGEDLYKIFIKKVSDGKWSIAEDSEINVKWFEKNKKHFKFYGRDIETLFAKTKIAHGRRVFCLDEDLKKKITLKDIDRGLEICLKNEETSNKDKEKFNKILQSMYC